MGVFVGLWPLLLFCFAVFRDGETQIWLGDVRFAASFWRFCVFLVLGICRYACDHLRLMLSFLICLPASPNVRTEPQSVIGQTRGKKKSAG